MDGFLSPADIYGWIGNIGFLIGALLLAYRRPIGCMWWNIMGNGFYVLTAYLANTPSLFWLSIILAAINIGGIVNWKRNAGKRNSDSTT